MATLYADEDFALDVVVELRLLGHDVLTVKEAGQGGKGFGDDVVLAFAVARQRAVVTFNKWDFVPLHRKKQPHFGIVVCTRDQDFVALSNRIHLAISRRPTLVNLLIRVQLPHMP